MHPPSFPIYCLHVFLARRDGQVEARVTLRCLLKSARINNYCNILNISLEILSTQNKMKNVSYFISTHSVIVSPD